MTLRRLRRFFSPRPLPAVGQMVLLPDDEAYHLRKILRLNVGSHCLVIDGHGHEAEAEICEFLEDGTVRLKMKCLSPKKRVSSSLFLRVVQAMPQRGKIDFLIEKAQELGVDEFWPVETKNSSARLSQEIREKVMRRWRKKSIEAAKQSGSLKLINIASSQPLERAVASIPSQESIVVFHPDPNAVSFRDWVARLQQAKKEEGTNQISLFFGPEGGFGKEEIKQIADQRNAVEETLIFVNLGESILKVETAFLGVVSSLRLLFS